MVRLAQELADLSNALPSEHTNARAYTSLGQLLYLSCILHVDGVVGNSSSGIMEVPSFKIPITSIGRIMNFNIIIFI
jgi:GDP/UDP-N,N'-diacetylbacillosamine 2-epimerase (hydrolysing)